MGVYKVWPRSLVLVLSALSHAIGARAQHTRARWVSLCMLKHEARSEVAAATPKQSEGSGRLQQPLH